MGTKTSPETRANLRPFLTPFWDQFWCHFGSKIGPILMSSGSCAESPGAASPRDCVSSFFGHLGHGKIIEKTIGCLWFLTHQRKPCSRRKALQNDTNMYPNLSQLGSKIGPKLVSEMVLNLLLILGCFLMPKWVPKWTQNGSKIGPKNGWQHEL